MSESPATVPSSLSLPAVPKALLIDLAGVLHVGDQPIPGAVKALQRLQQTDLPLRYLTNTTRTPCKAIAAKLKRIGFAIDQSDIYTAAMAAKLQVERDGLRPHYLVHPDLMDEMGESDPHPDVVVLGDVGDFLNYEELNHVFRLLRKGLPLLAMARNRYFKEGDGLSLDIGGIVAALEYSAGIKAEVAGKPHPQFFNTVLAELGIAAPDTVMIGDDLTDDIGGAQQVGIPGILVRTGKYQPGDAADEVVRAAAVMDDFTKVVDWVESGRSA